MAKMKKAKKPNKNTNDYNTEMSNSYAEVDEKNPKKEKEDEQAKDCN